MKTKRLAIVGAGASGLITLKNTLAHLPAWDIVCFEKSPKTTGCWGNPYPGFVSTSTKYTTQFSCFRKWDSTSSPAARTAKSDFFRDGEYGQYLDDFRDHFRLSPHIHLNTPILKIRRVKNLWSLDIGGASPRTETFHALILCTGLVAEPKPITSAPPLLKITDLPVRDKTIVVIGGGESGADHAHRLAKPGLRNRIFLSLKNGIRVSPRYHPIRSVPSDFLRNRLLLSISPTLRNVIGEKFVHARIRHREYFEKFFGTTTEVVDKNTQTALLRKYWDEKLTSRAKDTLFNVFHTKSDDFLDDVSEGRITIIGPPQDNTCKTYQEFDGENTITVEADFILPSIGFTSGLSSISEGEIQLSDFFHGCIHIHHPDLFLIGFARPIIGNIPTISEIQAKYVARILSGALPRPPHIHHLHTSQREQTLRTFPSLNTMAIHPVEMFPYCDQLSREMGTFPTLRKTASLTRWLRIQLSPATTMHYLDEDYDPEQVQQTPIHTPAIITLLLAIIRLIEKPLLLVIKPTPPPSPSSPQSSSIRG